MIPWKLTKSWVVLSHWSHPASEGWPSAWSKGWDLGNLGNLLVAMKIRWCFMGEKSTCSVAGFSTCWLVSKSIVVGNSLRFATCACYLTVGIHLAGCSCHKQSTSINPRCSVSSCCTKRSAEHWQVDSRWLPQCCMFSWTVYI